MINIVCVLRSGGDFLPEHVYALRDGVKRNLTVPHRFVCLSDVPLECDRIVLSRDWPGWWSKICLFEHGLFSGPVVSMDLDTVIVGNIDHMVAGHTFTALRDWLWPMRINSSLMAWDCDMSQVFERFASDPAGVMARYRTRDRWGDQAFIEHNAPAVPALWQDRFSGAVVSYKRDCRNGVPHAAKIVSFHGRPRPWQTSLWRPHAAHPLH